MASSEEAALYPHVKHWFTEVRGCDDAIADTPDEQRSVGLRRNLHRREIDVAAIQHRSRQRPLVHLAEGKRLCRGHSFEECLHQAESVLAYADHAWVFFPAEEWARLPEAERLQNEALVGKRGLGLLLVLKKSCEERIVAPLNHTVDGAKVRSVLNAFGIDVENQLLRIPTLGSEAARAAGQTMALCERVKAVVAEGLDCKAGWKAEANIEHGYYEEFLQRSEGTAFLTLDPFGYYLHDGVPAMWVWAHVTPTALRKAVAAGTMRGTHVYFDDDHWNSEVVSVFDVTPEVVERLARDGYGTTEDLLAMCQHIPLIGRELLGIQREVKMAVQLLDRKPA